MENCINCGANNFKVKDNYCVCSYCGSIIVPIYDVEKSRITIQDLRSAISLHKKRESFVDHTRGGIRL